MTYAHIEVRPITGTLGAEIRGVDLREPLAPDVLAELKAAFDEHLLITFTDQDLSPEQHLAFSAYFGIHQDLPHIPLVEGYPQLQKVLREAVDAKSKVVGQNWHSDSSFLSAPPLGVAMRAVEIPEAGGDTCFVNMCQVYESLSDGMKAMLKDLKAVHSATRVFGKEAPKVEERGRMREGVSVDVGEKESLHPVVRTHPRTGRKGLFVNRVYTQRFEGMTVDESQPLLGFLYSLYDKPEYGCRIRWRENMLMVWDNRFTQHRAIVDYHGQRRYMVRTTIQGERPA